MIFIEMENQLPVNEKKRNTLPKIGRAIRLFVYWFLGLFLLAISTALFLVYKYEDKVKQVIITELNKNLVSPVIIDPANIKFSIIKNFPYASLNFSDVKVLEVTSRSRKDTLIKAGVVSLQFNIINLLKDDYRIQQIIVEDGYARFKVDAHGKNNYEFWKKDSASDPNHKSSSFDLDRVKLKNVSIYYFDETSRSEIQFLIAKGVLSGKFSDKDYTLSLGMDAHANYIKVDEVNYLNEKDLNLNTVLYVASDVYTLNYTALKLNGLLFDVNGSIDNSKKTTLLDLDIQSSEGDIRSFLSLMPEKYQVDIKDYESEGEFKIHASIKGMAGDKKVPAIDVDFQISDANITNTVKDIVLTQVQVSAKYHNKNNIDHLEAKQFSCNVKEGFLKGDFSISDFKHPFLNVNLNADLSLSELKKIVKNDTIESLTGKVLVNGSFKGRLKGNGEITSDDIQNIKANGNVLVEDLSMRLKNNSLAFDSINGELLFDNLNMEIKRFVGVVSGSDLDVKGSLINIFPYLLYKENDVVIKASLNSNNIELDKLLVSKDEPSGGDTSYRFVLPARVDFVLDCSIKKLSFRKFDAQNIQGSLKIRDQKLLFDPLSFNTMQGSVSGVFMADASTGQNVLMTTDLALKNININQLFSQFENFGQEVITDKNLKGIANSTIQFASLWKPSLEIIPEKIVAFCDLTIDKGELIKWESLKSLSRFIKVSELENVKFSKLQNRIEIRDQIIYLPKMDIKSSALNLMVSGTHSFNNDIDYSIRVQLNELLSKRARENKKENDEFGEVADDGTGKMALYIKMTGNVDNPIVKYDRKGAKQKLKEDVKIEKQTMKQILKEEFGWYKKDTTLKDNNTKKDQPKDKFMIQWGDENKNEKVEEDE